MIGKAEMLRVLHAEHALSDRFIAYMLSRNIRIEEDLLDQLFNSTEKGIARSLLLRARYGTKDQAGPGLADALADGARQNGRDHAPRASAPSSRNSRGWASSEEGPAGLSINTSLLSVVLHD